MKLGACILNDSITNFVRNCVQAEPVAHCELLIANCSVKNISTNRKDVVANEARRGLKTVDISTFCACLGSKRVERSSGDIRSLRQQQRYL